VRTRLGLPPARGGKSTKAGGGCRGRESVDAAQLQVLDHQQRVKEAELWAEKDLTDFVKEQQSQLEQRGLALAETIRQQVKEHSRLHLDRALDLTCETAAVLRCMVRSQTEQLVHDYKSKAAEFLSRMQSSLQAQQAQERTFTTGGA
jgi:hypothetical protein